MKNFMENRKNFIRAIFIATLAILNLQSTQAMNQDNYFDKVPEDVLMHIIELGSNSSEYPNNFLGNMNLTCHRFHELISKFTIYYKIENSSFYFDQWLFSLPKPIQNKIKEYLYGLAHDYIENYSFEFLNNLPNTYFKRVILNVILFLKHNIFLNNVCDWNLENIYNSNSENTHLNWDLENLEHCVLEQEERMNNTANWYTEKLEISIQNLIAIINQTTKEFALDINSNDDFLEIALEIIYRGHCAQNIEHMFICKNAQLTTIPEVINRFVNLTILQVHTNPNLVNVPQDFGLHFPQMHKFNIDDTKITQQRGKEIYSNIEVASCLSNFIDLTIDQTNMKPPLKKNPTFPFYLPTNPPRGRPLGKSQTFCIKHR